MGEMSLHALLWRSLTGIWVSIFEKAAGRRRKKNLVRCQIEIKRSSWARYGCGVEWRDDEAIWCQ